MTSPAAGAGTMPSTIVLMNIEDGLFKTCFGEDDAWPSQLKSLTERSSSRHVTEALSSPGIQCVVIQEIGGTHWSHVIDYYKRGGFVVYFGVYGEFAAPRQLSKDFGLRWEFSAYTCHEYQLTEVGTRILGNTITQQQYTKANLVKVPEGDRIMVPKSHWETFEQFKEEECDSDDDDESAYERFQNHKQSMDNQVPLALHRAEHGGQIAYLGFVNGDGNIPKIVRALCSRTTTSGTSPTNHS